VHAPGLLSNHLTSTTAAAPELRYPGTLDNTERRFIHNLCGKLGLFSKSYGSKYVAAARPVGLHVGVASRATHSCQESRRGPLHHHPTPEEGTPRRRSSQGRETGPHRVAETRVASLPRRTLLVAHTTTAQPHLHCLHLAGPRVSSLPAHGRGHAPSGDAGCETQGRQGRWPAR